ncbi:hypothetical protein DY000_02006811 [Brassica cretica]|uniref:Uncharacterized protein n=1 Tax=Brassica cretica TaxID=69181 RepID=A0ABQ7CJM3_BRACR|nr:hypothetical protein DY000_02006811 [Brassica cretica]
MRIQKRTQRRTFLRPDRERKVGPFLGLKGRYIASGGQTGRYVASRSKPRRVLLVFAVKSQRKLQLRRNEKHFDEDSKENKKEDISEALQELAIGAVAAGVVLPALLRTAILSFVFPDNVLIKRFVAEKARSLGNLEKHVALASFRRGGAAVFRALGQGSFRGTTPMELDDYSKAFYPPS